MHSYRRTHRKRALGQSKRPKVRFTRTTNTQEQTWAILEAIGEYQATHQGRPKIEGKSD